MTPSIARRSGKSRVGFFLLSGLRFFLAIGPSTGSLLPNAWAVVFPYRPYKNPCGGAFLKCAFTKVFSLMLGMAASGVSYFETGGQKRKPATWYWEAGGSAVTPAFFSK
jgi:hypothetical protein